MLLPNNNDAFFPPHFQVAHQLYYPDQVDHCNGYKYVAAEDRVTTDKKREAIDRKDIQYVMTTLILLALQ